MAFDAKIQEDAYLNYAKLSYEIGNSYQSIPAVLNGFIEKYPNNPSRAEIETLLINSYITSKNYKEALTLLEKIKLLIERPIKKLLFTEVWNCIRMAIIRRHLPCSRNL